MNQSVDQSQCNEMNILIFIQLLVIVYAQENNDKKAKKAALMQKVPLKNKPSRENPNFVRDRLRNIILKPEMPSTWTDRHKLPYDSNWMDYCDPYHCDDYHRNVCGLNRKNMRFKWFQSMCHLILNNQCSDFRGFLKYDQIETKHCHAYVMFLRAGCPQHQDCEEYKFKPLCAMSSVDGHTVMFQNKCFLDAMNCRNSTLQGNGCDEHKFRHLCAMSSVDGHAVISRNKCFLGAIKCRNKILQEYDVVRMSFCEHLLDAQNSKEEEAKNDENPLIYKIKFDGQD